MAGEVELDAARRGRRHRDDETAAVADRADPHARLPANRTHAEALHVGVEQRRPVEVAFAVPVFDVSVGALHGEHDPHLRLDPVERFGHRLAVHEIDRALDRVRVAVERSERRVAARLPRVVAVGRQACEDAPHGVAILRVAGHLIVGVDRAVDVAPVVRQARVDRRQRLGVRPRCRACRRVRPTAGCGRACAAPRRGSAARGPIPSCCSSAKSSVRPTTVSLP